MKKIFALILSACLLAAIGTISNSCAPTQTPEVDTTRLVASKSSLSLTPSDSSQQSTLVLTCGCTFGPLVVTGYGGDTSDIHFSFADPLSAVISPHTLQAEYYPSMLKSPDTISAWIALSYQDESAGGSLLFDTVRASASN